MRFVVLDFETLNPSRKSGFSFCAMQFENGIRRSSVTRRFKPADSWISLWAMKSFEVTQQEVESFMSFRDSWDDIGESIGADTFVVCHNAEFDMSVLRHCLSKSNCDVEDFFYVCSLALAKLAWPNFRRYGLSELSELLGIDLIHHDPESDCTATGKLFMKELSIIGLEHSLTNGALLDSLSSLRGNLVKRFSMRATTNEF